jgi:hypothetical protein
VAVFVAEWRPRSISEGAAGFAREVVRRLGVDQPARAKALLWSCGRLAAFCESAGLVLIDGVVLSESSIERFVACGCNSFSQATRRTLRTNLRALRRGLETAPAPAAISRERAKAAYSEAEMAAYLALADAQPTLARRERANGLLSLGAGAGLTGVDLRAVRGTDVVCRSGGVVVCVTAGHVRLVPVLARYAERALAAASWAGDDFIVGGVELARRNVTSRLIASLSGGGDLPRLELPRLRATWLATVAELIGLPTFMTAAGISCSQRLGDVVGRLAPGGEAEAVVLLGGSC